MASEWPLSVLIERIVRHWLNTLIFTHRSISFGIFYLALSAKKKYQNL
jgi:hypothetical protein